MNPNSFGRTILPALAGMHSLQQKPLITPLRHNARRGSVTKVRASIIGIRSASTRYAQGDDGIAVGEDHRFDVRKSGWFDAANFLGDFLQRACRYCLSAELPAIADA